MPLFTCCRAIRVKQEMIFYDSYFKTLHHPKIFRDLIDNRADVPICVLEDKYIETNINLKHDLKLHLVDFAMWNMSKNISM